MIAPHAPAFARVSVPNLGELQVFGQLAMDLDGEVFDRAVLRNGIGVLALWRFAWSLGVNPDDVEQTKYARPQRIDRLQAIQLDDGGLQRSAGQLAQAIDPIDSARVVGVCDDKQRV